MTERLGRLSESELAQREDESDLTTMLVAAALDGAMNYAEIAPDGRELDAAERARAIDQLETGAIAIITTERERELVAGLDPTVPVVETLMLLRVMQQALICALSADPAVRARALDAHMVLAYARPAAMKWKEHLALRAG